MQRVLVSVKRKGEKDGYDLEVPAGVKAKELSRMIARALGWDEAPPGMEFGYRLKATPPKRALHAEETLADVSAWSGSYLTLECIPKPNLKRFHFQSKDGNRYPLSAQKMRIGRSTSTPSQSHGDDFIDLVNEAKSDTVSRNHAVILFQEGRWGITRATDSRNQTLVGETEVNSGQIHWLKDKDWVRLGSVDLQFCIDLPDNQTPVEK